MPEVATHPPGAFCWIELGTTDQNAAKDFYGKLFGWTFEDNESPGMTYTMFKLREKYAAACYTLDAAKMPGVPPHWMLYIATDDADASARRVGELGGKVTAPAFDVMEFGRMAILADPQGGNFCVWQAKLNKGIGVHNEPGAFCWGQLNTTDTAKAEAFYTALFGWQAKTGTGGGTTYTESLLGGNPTGGLLALPSGGPASPTAAPTNRPSRSGGARTSRRRRSRAWADSPSSPIPRAPFSPSTRSEKNFSPRDVDFGESPSS